MVHCHKFASIIFYSKEGEISLCRHSLPYLCIFFYLQNLISYMPFIFVYFIEMLNLSSKLRTCPNFPLYMLHFFISTFLYTKTRPQILEFAEPTPFYNVILHITIYNIFIKSIYFHIYIDTHNRPPRFHLKKKHKKFIQEWNGSIGVWHAVVHLQLIFELISQFYY